MGSSVSTLNRLVRISSGRCHYCTKETNRINNHPRQATKEHVVPKAFGGPNSLGNYVLACRECNKKRGTSLFYCKCIICSTMIEGALSDDKILNNIFFGLIEFNRVKVQAQDGKWTATRGSVRRHFNTWAEAMDYANNGTFMKGQ